MLELDESVEAVDAAIEYKNDILLLVSVRAIKLIYNNVNQWC
jgi:hypothetical protein